MLDSLQFRPRSRTAIACSIALHAGLLAAVLYRPTPRVLLASASLRGEGGRSASHILLAAPGVSAPPAAQKLDPDTRKRFAYSRAKKRAPVAQQPQASVAAKDLRPGMPGYVLGSLSSGFAETHDVRIALPIVAPDPPIARSRLPEWIRGDVVVEVTIDEQGHVVETRILQSIGFGIAEIVAATLHQWQYSPAKVDGVPVASRHDVHFHFPS
jgi:protein TonB